MAELKLVEIKIKDFLLSERSLSVNELFMISFIDYRIKNDGECTCSNSCFANFLEVSERQVVRYLRHLEKLKYVDIDRHGRFRKITMGVQYAIKQGTYTKGGN